MDGKVRVTADGAGEVGIVFQHQTVVALGFLLITRLGHAAEHTGVDDLLKGGAAHTFQNRAQLLGGGHILSEVVVDAACLKQSVETLQLLAVGFLVDTVDEGDLLDAGEVGRALVGQQHELLDHGLALAGGALLDVDAVAVLIEDQLYFPALKVDAAALGAQTGTVAVQLLHGGQLIQHFGVLCLNLGIRRPGQQGIDLRIHTLDPAADDRLDEAVIGQVAVLVQTHQAGECKAQFLLVQRADAVGQALGQHGHHLIRVVHRGGAVEGFLIQLRTGLDVIGNVRNVDAQLKAALRGAGQADGIVDVLGLGAVDGEDGQGTQVHAALAVLLRNRHIFELLCFFADLVREAGMDIAGVEQRLGAALGLVTAAEPHGHADAVVFLPVAAHQDLDGYLVAVLGTAFAVPHELHGDGRAVVRHELQAALDPADRTHEVVLLGEDGEDRALVAALHTGMLKLLDKDLVAGHCAAGEAAGDEDIAGLILQHDEGKVLAQLDHLTQQRLFGTAGAHGKEHARTLADDGIVHQRIQCLHHLAVGPAVAAEAGLQVLDSAGLILDGMFHFIA